MKTAITNTPVAAQFETARGGGVSVASFSAVATFRRFSVMPESPDLVAPWAAAAAGSATGILVPPRTTCGNVHPFTAVPNAVMVIAAVRALTATRNSV